MRVPHTIPVNTYRAYCASEQTVTLQAEIFRQLRSEDLTWDDSVPVSLTSLCLQVLSANFEVHSDVLPFLPDKDLDYLLEILPIDLPIRVIAPIIEDGIYWQRCCQAKWKNEPLDIRKYGNSWRRMFLERNVEEYIHYQEPGYIDWDDLSHFMEVCAPYVIHLNIKELKPPRSFDPEPIPPDECIRGIIEPVHMDLSPVITKLVNLQELSLRFGVRNCGMDFNPNFFIISLTDINNLSNGLENSTCLTKFCLHRCDINDGHVNIILSALMKCQCLESLEISHCIFGDIAAKAIGKLMLEHKILKKLLIHDNKIKSEGALGIAFALQNESCCPLTILNMQLNLIGDYGANYIAAALAKNTTLEELNLGGAGITSVGAAKIFESLLFSCSLRRIILSNNHLDSSVAEKIIFAVQNNRRIETLDIRYCGIGSENETTVHEHVAKNRFGSRDCFYPTTENY